MGPTTEIHPGGPHPGMVHQLYAERAAEEEAHRQRAAAEARRRVRNHLLLLRLPRGGST
jgi:hypothetical protein